MIHTISVSPQVYDLLSQRARQSHTSPDLLAENVLRVYLSQGEQEWREAFEVLIAKVHARTAAFSPQEIEADITAAARELC